MQVLFFVFQYFFVVASFLPGLRRFGRKCRDTVYGKYQKRMGFLKLYARPVRITDDAVYILFEVMSYEKGKKAGLYISVIHFTGGMRAEGTGLQRAATPTL